ncbi:hypothetical protein [Rhizobium leguminosarum]|uniref:hypothetical protein n=1 Tax=Rhizobium leguminosarum TaxID=384 RepID=UPI001C92155B|nr:hypothetical protein [Rhizobium leguminosarum]MBY3027076.1 hypothetical protein [Rhizobium leguminosarum]
MQSNDDNDLIDNHRRRFLGAAATVFAGSHIVGVGSTHAGQLAAAAALEVAATFAVAVKKQDRSWRPQRQLRERRRFRRPGVIPLHGWPYDIHCYSEVASILAEDGYRVIVRYPHLRTPQ